MYTNLSCLCELIASIIKREKVAFERDFTCHKNMVSISDSLRSYVQTHSFSPLRANETNGVQKAQLDDAFMNVSILKIPPNTAVPSHRHHGSEALLFLQGEETLGYSIGDTIKCQQGDLLISADGTAHSAITGPTETLILGYWEHGSKGVVFDD
tara:strand:- start:13 stop:474 length:462 start_codon:yes stop_codon:yes gene_type:complete